MQTRKQQTAALLCFFCMFCISSPSLAAAPTELSYIVTSNHGIYKNIIDLSLRELNKNHPGSYQAKVISLEKEQYFPQQTADIITIGTRAAQHAYQHYPNASIISALLTQSAFEKLSIENYGNKESAIKSGVTPLFINQPFSRYFHLGLLLIKDAKTVGILVGPANKVNIQEISRYISAQGLTPYFALISAEKNPIEVIDPIIKKSDFFVVLPDQQLINRTAAKWVLQLGYLHKTPVIAYSHKYVQAGALAAIFSSPEDIAKSIVHTVLQQKYSPVSGKNKLSFPLTFSVASNKSVARSLKIPLLDMKTYRQQINKIEQRTP